MTFEEYIAFAENPENQGLVHYQQREEDVCKITLMPEGRLKREYFSPESRAEKLESLKAEVERLEAENAELAPTFKSLAAAKEEREALAEKTSERVSD